MHQAVSDKKSRKCEKLVFTLPHLILWSVEVGALQQTSYGRYIYV